MDDAPRSRGELDVKRERDRMSPRARSMDAVRARAHAPRRLRYEAARDPRAGARATTVWFMIGVYRVHKRTPFRVGLRSRLRAIYHCVYLHLSRTFTSLIE